MTKVARMCAATIAAAFACTLLLVGATAAPAAGPPIESYQSQGEARGLDVAFTFSGSIFERLLDLGMPHARSGVSSEGGGAARGSAAQVYPGDVVIGAAGEQIPGYRSAVFPAEKAEDKPDDSHVSDTFQMPGMIEAGPVLSVDTGHLVTTASANGGSGLATTSLIKLGQGTPLFTVKSIESESTSKRAVDSVEHVARTIVHDLKIVISPELTVTVGDLVATARTSSDGASPTAIASLRLAEVAVVMNGVTYQATIDEKGLRIVGAPSVPLPSPLPQNPIPENVPQDANQTLGVILKQAGVQISAAQGTKTVEDISGDASLSGLLITFTGMVPNVFVPDVVAQLVYEEIVPRLPEQVRRQLERSICYVEDIKPLLPKQITENPQFPNLPVCVSPAIIPGPGSGVVTSFSIGKVRSQSAAVQGIANVDPPAGGDFGNGGIFPPGDGELGGVVPPDFTQPPPTGNGQGGKAPLRFGLVARLPSGALYGAGLGFFLLAMALALGPSLRQWRATQEP